MREDELVSKVSNALAGRDVNDAIIYICGLAVALRRRVEDLEARPGVEDLSADFDGERTLKLRFSRGEITEEISICLPVPLDRGVFKQGRAYCRGDGVTHGGSFWIAQKDFPEGKPDSGNGSWRLAVKHGADLR